MARRSLCSTWNASSRSKPDTPTSTGRYRFWRKLRSKQTLGAVKSRSDKVIVVDGLAIGERLGKAQLANSVLLGALSCQIEGIDPDVWTTVIQRRVPKKYAELNRAAFWEGRM